MEVVLKNKKDFQHFIITRFNLKNADWTKDKNSGTILNKQWLDFRYNLFVKYCLPSLKNQTNQNFIWLVYFDINTPKKYKEINKKISRDFKNFIPVYKASNKLFLKELSSDILKVSKNIYNYFITTRIDNDDAFHLNTINVIQNQFSNQERQLINLPLIYSLNLKNKLLRKRIALSNPFISLIELNKTNKLETVFKKNHYEWQYQNNVFNLEDNEVYCLQIIHNRNLINTLIGKLVADNHLGEKFGNNFNIISFNYFETLKISLINKIQKIKQFLKIIIKWLKI